MRKIITAVFLFGFMQISLASQYQIIIKDNINIFMVDVEPPASPSIDIKTDIDKNKTISYEEKRNISTISVDILLPNGLEAGDRLKVTNKTDTILTESQITAGKLTFDYNVPNYGETLTIAAQLIDKNNNESSEINSSVFIDDTVKRKELIGTTYLNKITSMTTILSQNFVFDAWVKPKKAIKTSSVQSNVGVDGTSGENYVFYPRHGGDNTGNHGVGISVGTNGYKVFAHSGGYMPALFVKYTPISSTEWTHFLVVIRNNVPNIYVNGEYVGTGLPPSSGVLVNPMNIGDTGYGPIDAELAFERLWSGTMTNEEVLNVYNKYKNINDVYGSATLKELKDDK